MPATDQDLARRAVAKNSENLFDEHMLCDMLGLLETTEERCEDDACEHISSPSNQ